MSQQARKEQEGAVVRRLTLGAGAAALGLAWYFTASATSSVPIAFGAQTAPEQPVVGMEQLDDHVFVRTQHVPAPRPAAGGVRAAGAAAASGGSTATTATRTTSGGTTTAPASAAAPAPIAQPVPAATPAPTPKPVATTGPSTPAK